MNITQGDSFSLPIKIKYNNQYVTPSNVTDVRIQVANTLKTYSKSEITFDSSTNEWKYPITQKESLLYSDTLVPLQVGIKSGTDIIYSSQSLISVNVNIIRSEW